MAWKDCETCHGQKNGMIKAESGPNKGEWVRCPARCNNGQVITILL